jgi:hypothetical protein
MLDHLTIDDIKALEAEGSKEAAAYLRRLGIRS